MLRVKGKLMPNQSTFIQPGPIFYEVFAGLVKAQGGVVSEFASRHGKSATNLKAAATGCSNGPEARRIRQLMMAEVGHDVFRIVYEKRLKTEGVVQ